MTGPRRVLMESGLRPRKSLGQNFLVDPNVAWRIVDALAPTGADTVLEIGCGTGALTRPLAERAGRVVGVEIDEGLFAACARELADLPNVDLVPGDVRAVSPEEFADRAGRRLLVAGNLPYYLSSEVVFFLLAHFAAIDRAVLMFQKEVADRLRARPGGKEYGVLSVLVQYRCDVEAAFDVPPACFHPPPEVTSTVAVLRFKERPDRAAKDEARLTRLVKAGFGQRRKTLRNALAGVADSADDAARRLGVSGIDPMRRAETLSVGEWVALSDAW
jgi:16S rRNA (adenine1518-N6/adenine1519-N6)-dimethyltransferase